MTPRDSRVQLFQLGRLVLCLLIAGCSASALAQDRAAAVDDRFASEPERAKAESPIRFTGSWDEARALARRSGRRLMAYFTGEACGWCRALEKRTFTDAEVVELSRQFVCVEINIGEDKNLRVADEYRIDTIPRTYIFTADDRIIDRRTGYLPAAEYAAWLSGVGTTPPPQHVEGRKAVAPAPVGASTADSDLVVWFVDGSRGIGRWSDVDWTNHGHLLQLLRARGMRPRLEHIAREDFPARWDRAVLASKVPDLVSAENWAGLIKELDDKGRLISVRSDRLVWMTDVATCADFKGRSLYRVGESEHGAVGQRAIDELLRPGPETGLPGTELAAAAGRVEAESVARRAVVGYVAGHPESLKQVASASSPQLARCTRPGEFRHGWTVQTGSVELRGNEAIAFAIVEMRFQGKSQIGADPVLVVLRREESQWKAFSVSSDLVSIQALPALCRLQFKSRAGPPASRTPRLLYPGDGGRIGEGGRSFAWEIPAGSEPPAAQICEVFLDDKDSSWPVSRIKVFDGKPLSRALLSADTAQNLTGVTAHAMRWCVWALGADGSILPSEVRGYRPMGFKY